MILNSIIKGSDSGGSSVGDFLISAASSLGSGYAPANGTRLKDASVQKKIIDDGIAQGFVNQTSSIDQYGGYGIGSYLDNEKYITTWSGSYGDTVRVYVYSRSATDGFTESYNGTISGAPGYVTFNSRRLHPFKFKNYYVFPCWDSQSDGDDMIYYRLFYTTNGSSWSSRLIWSGTIANGDAEKFDCATDGTYIYCIVKNYTSLITYRMASPTSAPESNTYTIDWGTQNVPTIAPDGAWICGPRYYSTSWNGTLVDLGSSSALGQAAKLHKIDGEYWYVRATDQSVRIASTIAGLVNASSSFSWGANDYDEWEHGLYRIGAVSGSAGPSIAVRTKAGSMSFTCKRYNANAMGSMSIVVYHKGALDGMVHAHSLQNNYTSSGLFSGTFMVGVGLEDMNEPRYKVKSIWSKTYSGSGGNPDGIQFEDIGVVPYAIFFYTTNPSNSQMTGGVIFPQSGTGSVSMSGATTLTPTVTVTGTTVGATISSGYLYGRENFACYAVYGKGIADTYKTFMKVQ